MNWVLAVTAAWFALAGLVAVLIGRGIRLADQKAAAKAKATTAEDSPNFVVDASPQVETDVGVVPVTEVQSAEPRSAAERARPNVPTAHPSEPGPTGAVQP
jgi:hypothetical protein